MERLERQLARLLDWENLLLKKGYGAAGETLAYPSRPPGSRPVFPASLPQRLRLRTKKLAGKGSGAFAGVGV